MIDKPTNCHNHHSLDISGDESFKEISQEFVTMISHR